MKLLGTPLNDKSNYLPIWKQEARDEHGKKLWFHGAFTGGRSAGYHGTVGSKEGWTPSQDYSRQLRIEDFQDQEDVQQQEQNTVLDPRLGEKVLRQMGWDGEEEVEQEETDQERIYPTELVGFVKATVQALIKQTFPRLPVPPNFVPKAPKKTSLGMKRSMAAMLLLAEEEEEEEAELLLSREQAKLALSGFQPFTGLKQARYQAYLAHIADAAKLLDPIPGIDLDRELDEFKRAALLYKPLPAQMASRFHTATNVPKKETPAVESKQIERITTEWHPNSLVCSKLGLEYQESIVTQPESLPVETPLEIPIERPPTDLFKSIFGSDDDDNEKEKREFKVEVKDDDLRVSEKRPLRQRPKASDFFK